MLFCKSTKINIRVCPCIKCKKNAIKTGNLSNLYNITSGFESIKVNVYINYVREGRSGLDIFIDDLAGLEIPKYKENRVTPKFNDRGDMVSPYYAWQATIYIKKGSPAANEIAAIYGNKFKEENDMMVIHSNALAKTILRMKGDIAKDQ